MEVKYFWGFALLNFGSAFLWLRFSHEPMIASLEPVLCKNEHYAGDKQDTIRTDRLHGVRRKINKSPNKSVLTKY